MPAFRGKKKHKYKHVHIYTFFKYVSRFMFLLIIPLIQHILLQPQSLIGFIGAMGFNVLCVILLVTITFAEYRSTAYYNSDDEFSIRRGFIIHRRAKIPHSAIETVTIQRNFLPMLTGARMLHMDTPAVGTNDVDVNLYLTNKKIEAILSKIYNAEVPTTIYKSNNLRIMLMAATWSNSFTGYLIFVPFINKVGDILGREFSEMLYSRMDVSIYFAAIGIPPAAATLASLALIGWAVSFIFQFFGYFSFKTQISDNYIQISRGFINKTMHVTPKDKINVLQLRQNILMIPIKLYGVFAYTISSGKTKGDKSMIVPAQQYSSASAAVKEILGMNTAEDNLVRPGKAELVSYLLIPFYVMLGMIAAQVGLYLLKVQSEILQLLMVLTAIITVVWAVFMMVAHKRSFIAGNDDCLIVGSYSGFTITKSYISYEKIQSVVVRRSIFQRMSKDCTVKIYAYGERRHCFIVRQLNYVDVYKTISKII